uniref:Uncharacterized protein n=1 Tax=Pristionchus pacificus TaxID=54126 RepID=A0A8R1YX19_PRIPA
MYSPSSYSCHNYTHILQYFNTHSPFLRSRRAVRSHPRSLPSPNPRPSAWTTGRVSPIWIIKRRTHDGFSSAQVIYGQERPHSRRLLREFTLNHASQNFGGWIMYFVAQDLSTQRDGQSTTKAKKKPSLDPQSLSSKIPIPSITMFPPAGNMP